VGRSQANGEQASGLFFRGNGRHITHDRAIFAQGAEERPVGGFKGGKLKSGSGDCRHSVAILGSLTYDSTISDTAELTHHISQGFF